MTFRSPIVRDALAVVRQLRLEFQDYQEHAYREAETETNGVLLNRRGKRAGIDPYSLFSGSDARARAYASEELIEHWLRHPRPVFEEFEAQAREEHRNPDVDRLADIIRRAKAELAEAAPDVHAQRVAEILEEL